MVKEKSRCKDINSSAAKACGKQRDRNEQPPAKNLPDSKAPPTGCSANTAETKTWCSTQAKVLAMIQSCGAANKALWTGAEAEVLAFIKQSGVGPNESGPCHNCGKEGHWLRKCKEARKDRGNVGILRWKKAPHPAKTPVTQAA